MTGTNSRAVVIQWEEVWERQVTSSVDMDAVRAWAGLPDDETPDLSMIRRFLEAGCEDDWRLGQMITDRRLSSRIEMVRDLIPPTI